MHPQRTDDRSDVTEKCFCKALETLAGIGRICALWTATGDTDITIDDTTYYMSGGNMNVTPQ